MRNQCLPQTSPSHQAPRLTVAIIRGSSTVIGRGTYNIQEVGLAKSLHALGVRCDVFMAGEVSSPESEEIAEDRQIGSSLLWRVPMLALPGKQGVSRHLFPLLRRSHYDIIQVHEDTQATTLLAAAWARRRRMPAVLCQGMYENYRGMSRLLQLGWDTLPLWAIRRSVTDTFAKSRAARDYLNDKRFRGDVVLPVGIDTTQLVGGPERDWRAMLSLRPETILSLYVGSIDDRRRVDVAVRAFQNLRSSGLPVHLAIVGDGPRLNNCRELAAHDANSAVSFLGRLPQNQLGGLYSQADICILPTTYEIYGLTAVEAMACGTPVIASAVGGLLDLVIPGKNGYLVDTLRVDAWEGALRQYAGLEPARRRQLGVAAKAKAMTLTWDALAPRWADEYLRVANSKRD